MKISAKYLSFLDRVSKWFA